MVFKDVPGGVEFRVKVTPGSARTTIVGILGDVLKVALNAPPEKGKANKALVKLIAEKLHLGQSAVKIISGQTGPRKTVFVEGISSAACERGLL